MPGSRPGKANIECLIARDRRRSATPRTVELLPTPSGPSSTSKRPRVTVFDSLAARRADARAHGRSANNPASGYTGLTAGATTPEGRDQDPAHPVPHSLKRPQFLADSHTEVVALLFPARRQRTLQLFQHQRVIRSASQDTLHDLRRQQRPAAESGSRSSSRCSRRRRSR